MFIILSGFPIKAADDPCWDSLASAPSHHGLPQGVHIVEPHRRPQVKEVRMPRRAQKQR